MALTANANLNFYPDSTLAEFPVAAGAHIYRDALVGLDPAGYLKPFEPCDLFVGIAFKEADNTLGTAGDTSHAAGKHGFAQVRVAGCYDLPSTAVPIYQSGKEMYATADDAVAFIGHPDAYVGRMIHKTGANTCRVELKKPGEKPKNHGEGSVTFEDDYTGERTATGAVAGNIVNGDFAWNSALGLGVSGQATSAAATAVAAVNGGAIAELDSTSETAFATIETPIVLDPVLGVTIDARMHLLTNPTTGVAAFVALVADMTDAKRAAFNDNTTGVANFAAFTLTAAADIKTEADDGTNDVAAVDTTINNTTTAGAFLNYRINVRPSGLAEFWLSSIRYPTAAADRALLAVCSLAGATALGGIIGLGKTSAAGVGKMRIAKLRVCGAKA